MPQYSQPVIGAALNPLDRFLDSTYGIPLVIDDDLPMGGIYEYGKDVEEGFDPNVKNGKPGHHNVNVNNDAAGYGYGYGGYYNPFGYQNSFGYYDFGVAPYLWRTGGYPYTFPMNYGYQTPQMPTQTVVNNKDNTTGQKLANTQLSMVLLSLIGIGLLAMIYMRK